MKRIKMQTQKNEAIVTSLIKKIQQIEDSDEKQLKLLNHRIKQQTISLISTALILMCAFVWKDIFEVFLSEKLDFQERSLKAKLIIGIVFTLIALVCLYMIVKFIEFNHVK